MPYNSIISRTDAAALIPEVVSREILQSVPEQSACMRMGRRLANMPRAQTRMPVLSALPTAYFVTGDNSKKQTTEVNWTNVYIDAEELAVIVPIPEAVLDDADYDIWGEVKPKLVEAFGVAIDDAVINGTNIPTSWTTNLGAAGLIARCTAASHTISLAAYTDLYEAIMGETAAGVDGLLMLLEADGFIATGHVAHTSVKGQIRNCRDVNGQPIFKAGPSLGTTFATGELDGAPILYPLNGVINSATCLDIAGDWTKLVYSMRQDITYKVLDQAVITDAQGAIIYNLAQQDMVALRAVMRVGFSLPNVLNRMNQTALTRCAFATLTA
jgi:HK97 family phage major capsid protein